MDSVRQDVRAALRGLSSNRGLALLCVICLGLGIGVNTMVFSLVNAVLLRPLPIADPERVLLVNGTRQTDSLEITPLSYPDYLDLGERATGIAELGAVSSEALSLSDGAEPVRVEGAFVSANLFRLLGVRPALGRGLDAQDDRPGATPVVLLSDALFRGRYGGDASVLGRTLVIGGEPRTVVGVMPPHFPIPRSSRLWLPLGPRAHASPRQHRSLAVYARVADGVAPARAAAALETSGRELAARHPEAGRERGVRARPLNALVSDRVHSLLVTMMGAVGLVLLIACADVANVMLARGVARRREFAVRAVLGASRGRLVRQQLLESALVGLAAVPLGLGVARLGLDLLVGAIPEAVRPDLPVLSLDAAVVAFTVLAALATSLLFGLLPALQAGRRSFVDALTQGGREATDGASQRRLKNALVAAEVALSVVLLVGAGLFLESFLSGVRADPGFQTETLLTLQVDLDGSAYDNEAARVRRVDDLLARLQALPGIRAAAVTDLEPLRGGGRRTAALTEGALAEDAPTVLYGGIGGGYFEALEVPLVRGRGFSSAELRTRTAVAVVNRTFAERLWPGSDPIGRRFCLADDPRQVWFSVVGVARDVLTWDLSDRAVPTAFLPWPHVGSRRPGLLLRGAGDPADLVAPARAAAHASDPALLVFGERTLDEVRRLTFWRRRLLSGLFGSFGGFALLLAAVGAWGVLAYWVRRRTREIGVRMALGATRGAVVRLVVWQGLQPVAVGLVVGLAGGVALTRVLRGSLYELGGVGSLNLMGVTALLVVVGLSASYWPARRAASIDPIEALRE